jgi:hypothetical protein
MPYELFWLLHGKLSPGIAKDVDDSRRYERKGGRGVDYKLPPVRNGPVFTSISLACALQYFVGALQYDIMAKCGISKKSVRESLWAVVKAVNSLDEFIIEYPDSFQSVSEVKFSSCGGAIDGILIWILKPSKEDAAMAGCGRRKFFCGCKGKFD